ncbi:MAG: pyruvate formate lyase family protein, partial [Saccharofermentanales bacterium]
TLRTDFCSCIRSALTSDCLENGRHLFLGGARYYAVQNEVVGLTNTANALQAIQQVVFEEKRLSVRELTDILDTDFSGNEVLRQYLLNKVPKFGNGILEVDRLRGQITEEFFSRLASHAAPLGGRHWPGEVIFHYNTMLGKTTLASPDGRRSGEPFADSSGPSQGTDREGVLGIFQSMKQICFSSEKYPNTCSCLNLKFDLSFWKRARRPIIDLLRTYMQTGFQLQINVLNAQDLEDALIHPENYSWLVVRVGGYSAYFTALDPDIQRDIIARTTQAKF